MNLVYSPCKVLRFIIEPKERQGQNKIVIKLVYCKLYCPSHTELIQKNSFCQLVDLALLIQFCLIDCAFMFLKPTFWYTKIANLTMNKNESLYNNDFALLKLKIDSFKRFSFLFNSFPANFL